LVGLALRPAARTRPSCPTPSRWPTSWRASNWPGRPTYHLPARAPTAGARKKNLPAGA
jgi:hypothetical protein